MLLLLALVYISYFFLAHTRSQVNTICLTLLFITMSGLLRLHIPFDGFKDYLGYSTFLFGLDVGSANWLIEPYRVVVGGAALLMTSSVDRAVATWYVFHFGMSSLFFVWLATRRDLSIYSVMFIFAYLYPNVTFVWLRFGLAFILVCLISYQGPRSTPNILLWLAPFVHLASTPFVVLGFLYRKIKLTQLVIVFAFLALLWILPITGIIEFAISKFTVYSDTQKTNSLFHTLFTVFLIGMFVYHGVRYPAMRTHFFVLLAAIFLGASLFDDLVGQRIGILVMSFYLLHNAGSKHSVRFGVTAAICLCMGSVFIFRFFGALVDA